MIFRSRWLPWCLIAPQLAVTAIFFLWPAGVAIWQSAFLVDPWTGGGVFVGFDNFTFLLGDPNYRESFAVTAIFSFSVAGLSMGTALLLAVAADRVLRGGALYRNLLVWPYAVAPAIAAVVWLFMFNPSIGLVAYYLKVLGYDWNHVLNDGEAMLLVVLAASWKQISYNFLFFLAGLQAIPRSLIEAAAIDGASPARRFWTIILPLLSPTTFFLLVVNLVYAFFDTFGIIHLATSGGPQRSTTTLVYKVFSDGYEGGDLGSSAAQSVILLVIVGFLTVIQFRWIERRVHY